ncbi:MAG TPA: hypothetical protein VF602_12325 [Pedobacter sp.]|jgi:hypothetical protein
MSNRRKIHQNQNYDHDEKYSVWRRDIFPELSGVDWAYCTDIDWVEWRRGRPVAFIECRRAIGSLPTAEAVIKHFKTLNNGFQFEVLARVAKETGAKAYIVGIEDRSIDSDDYSNARFVVEEVIPPKNYNEEGRINLNDIKVKRLPSMNQEQYVKFIRYLSLK